MLRLFSPSSVDSFLASLPASCFLISLTSFFLILSTAFLDFLSLPSIRSLSANGTSHLLLPLSHFLIRTSLACFSALLSCWKTIYEIFTANANFFYLGCRRKHPLVYFNGEGRYSGSGYRICFIFGPEINRWIVCVKKNLIVLWFP